MRNDFLLAIRDARNKDYTRKIIKETASYPGASRPRKVCTSTTSMHFVDLQAQFPLILRTEHRTEEASIRQLPRSRRGQEARAEAATVHSDHTAMYSRLQRRRVDKKRKV